MCFVSRLFLYFFLRALHLYIPAHLSRSKEATLLSSVCTISSIVIACARAFLLGNAYYVWYTPSSGRIDCPSANKKKSKQRPADRAPPLSHRPLRDFSLSTAFYFQPDLANVGRHGSRC